MLPRVLLAFAKIAYPSQPAPPEYMVSHELSHIGRASSVAQLVKNLSAMQKTPAQFLGWENPLGNGQAMHSSILGLPWRLRQ